MFAVCKKKREKSLPKRKDMTLNASLRRHGEARDGGLRDDVSCGESSREIDESTFDVIIIVEVQQIQYIGRVVDIPVVRGEWRLPLSKEPVTSELSWFMDEPTAVTLEEKLALKSLDVVDETRAKWP